MVSSCLIVDLCPFSEPFFLEPFFLSPYRLYRPANFHKKVEFYTLGLTNHHPDYNWLVLVQIWVVFVLVVPSEGHLYQSSSLLPQ